MRKSQAGAECVSGLSLPCGEKLRKSQSGDSPMSDRICTVEGCIKALDSRGFCKSHYARWRRYGDPLEDRTKRGRTLTHGTVRGYAYGCRCDGCRTSRSAYIRDRGYARRRNLARRAGASNAASNYTSVEIFERDGWVCGICDSPIDSAAEWPERGCATVDHVMPLSLGGADEPENVQAAHASCNSSKGNRPANQRAC